ncbi:MAG: tetratricopeptide repeat protein [Acidobacteriia bacterium]|nr:tetratricopeptide repeat protein [Terriglobia bacterium]
MKKHSILLAVAALLFLTSYASAQTQLAKVSGKVIGRDGKPLASVIVTYTNTATHKTFKMKTEKNGDYFGVGFPDGLYDVSIISGTGELLFSRKSFTVGLNPSGMVFNVDLRTVPQEAPKPSQEQLDALKAQRETALKENAIITQTNAAVQAKNWADAASGFKQLIELRPDRYDYYSGLGEAQLNLGQYEDAVHTYDKGIQVAQAGAGPKDDPARIKAVVGQMLTNQGNCYLKMRKTDQALAAYEKAAALSPNPGTAYFNLCATQYNAGKMDEAAAACAKAIAADPTKADAYFIRGSALYGSGKLDAQSKYVVPPGTVEALKKYLELAPQGGHVEDVKAMLEALGAKI